MDDYFWSKCHNKYSSSEHKGGDICFCLKNTLLVCHLVGSKDTQVKPHNYHVIHVLSIVFKKWIFHSHENLLEYHFATRSHKTSTVVVWTDLPVIIFSSPVRRTESYSDTPGVSVSVSVKMVKFLVQVIFSFLLFLFTTLFFLLMTIYKYIYCFKIIWIRFHCNAL